MFYPVAGWIADAFVGRYRVILAGFWMFIMGFGIILLSMALEWHIVTLNTWHMLPAITATVLFMLGSASVESTIIPFGVDQIEQGAPSEEMSSYFFWYYFGRNLGYVANIITIFVVDVVRSVINDRLGLSEFNQLDNSTSPIIIKMQMTIDQSVVGLIALLTIAIALFLHFRFHHWFFMTHQRANAVASIYSILYFAATVKRQPPKYRRSFRYGEEKKSRLELAKVEFDGIFSAEEVEDVKTFLRILFFLMSLGFGFATFGAVSWNMNECIHVLVCPILYGNL